jgi:hypothetical protein
VLALDPNPYWMGFYASRPEAKRRANRIVRQLVVAEKLTVLPARSASGVSPEHAAVESEIARDLRRAWDLVVLSNHHDFITGTSPDRIWQEEQQPWLEQAEDMANHALARIRTIRPPAHDFPPSPPPLFSLDSGRLVVETDAYRIELSEQQGGAITSFRLSGSGEELLAGPANDLVSYRDSGGLWRMGHEFRGGFFVEHARSSQQPARIKVHVRNDVLEVRAGPGRPGQFCDAGRPRRRAGHCAEAGLPGRRRGGSSRELRARRGRGAPVLCQPSHPKSQTVRCS